MKESKDRSKAWDPRSHVDHGREWDLIAALVMCHPNRPGSLPDAIKPKVFDHPACRWACEFMLKAWDAGEEVHLSWMMGAIPHDKRDTWCKDFEAMAEHFISPLSIPRLSEKLIELSVTREIILEVESGGGPETVFEIVNRWRGEAADLEVEPVPAPDGFSDILRDLAARQERGTTVGLLTGIPRWDDLTGGLQPGVHLLAAEPGMGKTTLALQVAAKAAADGCPALFVSFEEGVNRLILKAVCQKAGLDWKGINEGWIGREYLEKAMVEHAAALAPLSFLPGVSRLKAAHIESKAKAIMEKHGADRCFVIIDFLQRWASGRGDFKDFRHVVSGLLSELREASTRLDSPFLVISSQNRTGMGAANLTSLKESGDLEYSADSVSFLVDPDNRKAIPPARAVDLVIRKNRYGDIGTVNLIFRPDIGEMREEETLRPMTVRG